jgi:transcriptional regulator with XRE-family HTH domain
MKKITISEKLKNLRIEKGLNQGNIGAQSNISQIENGRITNPNKTTLKYIANKMDITFEELIDGTTWIDPENNINELGFAFSPTAVVVNISNMGQFVYSHRVFPSMNENDELNKYCPNTGELLLVNCKKCQRQFQTSDQKYCTGCGQEILEEFPIESNIKHNMRELNSKASITMNESVEHSNSLSDTIYSLSKILRLSYSEDFQYEYFLDLVYGEDGKSKKDNIFTNHGLIEKWEGDEFPDDEWYIKYVKFNVSLAKGIIDKLRYKIILTDQINNEARLSE